MPSEKTARVQERHRRINRLTRSSSRKAVKKAELLISKGESPELVTTVTKAISALDRAVSKGVIHRNNAARRKSRLASKANKLQN